MNKKIVQVIWEDCEVVAENWIHPDELEIPGEDAAIYSYGLLWSEDKRGIVLIADYDDYRGCVGRGTWIPRSQIKQITVIGKLGE